MLNPLAIKINDLFPSFSAMRRKVAILLFDQFQLLDAAGPATVFEIAARDNAKAPYSLFMIARLPGPVRSSSGVVMQADAMASARGLDTLIVMGGAGTDKAVKCAETLTFVRKQARLARRVCSVCSGAFVLAAAGVLEGRRATTHWRVSNLFARVFPAIKLESDRIYIRDGKFWTSAGITAGIDLALALVAEDLGDDVAKEVAREMVVYHRRSGGQSQFSAMQELVEPDGRFGKLLEWVRENLSETLSVEALSERAHMSPRHFARTFQAETGLTPAKAIERIRLDVARSQVESSKKRLEQVATDTGFSDPERMRRAFLRTFGHPPQALRRSAQAGAAIREA